MMRMDLDRDRGLGSALGTLRNLRGGLAAMVAKNPIEQ